MTNPKFEPRLSDKPALYLQDYDDFISVIDKLGQYRDCIYLWRHNECSSKLWYQNYHFNLARNIKFSSFEISYAYPLLYFVTFYQMLLFHTVNLRFTSSRLTLFRFNSSKFLFSLTSPFFGTNCDVNRGITVNLYTFFKFLVKNIQLCSMCNMKFDLRRLFLNFFDYCSVL